jgi:hypothetical protein
VVGMAAGRYVSRSKGVSLPIGELAAAPGSAVGQGQRSHALGGSGKVASWGRGHGVAAWISDQTPERALLSSLGQAAMLECQGVVGGQCCQLYSEKAGWSPPDGESGET